MDDALWTLEPPALDAWLREQLGRRMVLAGVTLAPTGSGGDAPLQAGEPPADLLAGLAVYGEIWVRWSKGGVLVSAALHEAAEYDADVVLAWLGSPAVVELAPADWAGLAVAALVREADGMNLRDRCIIVLAGPEASQALARRAGCDAGFAPDVALAGMVGTLAREAAAREEFRRKGSSPPCYL